MSFLLILVFFFFNDTATTEIYTLSLHDALPICSRRGRRQPQHVEIATRHAGILEHPARAQQPVHARRSEEHTSELQSQSNIVCRLLLEKKKKIDSALSEHKHSALYTHHRCHKVY